MRKRIVILGSTGSIGESAFRVVQQLPERFEVIGLAAGCRTARLAEQAAALGAKAAVTSSAARLDELKSMLPPGVRAGCGEDAMVELVTRPDVDLVLCAVVGTAGLLPVLAALRAGKQLALASKEVLVMAGGLVMKTAAEHRAAIVPVDSEHSAIFQCLQGRRPEEVSRLILTASGGAFRDLPAAEMVRADCRSALAHPTWAMGPKVTIDSASLMNKALELVEAHHLFAVPPEKLRVLIHPQSLVHSMVEMVDRSLLAQLSVPDMRFAIQYALTWPERETGNLPHLDFTAGLRFDFREPDRVKYPSLDFAEEAMRRGGTLPAVMNAANEVAVEKFRAGRIVFPAIWSIIEKTMSAHTVRPADHLEGIIEADRWARAFAAAGE